MSDTAMQNKKIVSDWITLQSVEDRSVDTEFGWAEIELNILSVSSPDECWDIIMDILERSNDPWVLENLAAGPLENLFAIYPEETLVKLEETISNNRKLKKLLAGVWQNLIPLKTWQRIQQLRIES